ncbi:hypothetical protein [Streptomyces sannanensis]|uniref:hypothetical protein n=1 Tax=Streptomyces sannanensis TaxID=285536 RepID=UPI0031ED4D08
MNAQQEKAARPVANPARWAADIVAMMREGARLRLDYSARSLWNVDWMIGRIRREDPPPLAVAGTLRGFGAYAGEVLVRDVPIYGDPHSAVPTLVQVGMTANEPNGEIVDTFSCTAIHSRTGIGSTR